MMEMLEKLAEQMATQHAETMNALRAHEAQKKLGQAVTRMSGAMTYIAEFQAEVDEYWRRTRDSSPKGERWTIDRSIGAAKIIADRNLDELRGAVRAIGHEFQEQVIDSDLLGLISDVSLGDYSEVDRVGRLLLDLVSCAPLLEGTYWHIHL